MSRVRVMITAAAALGTTACGGNDQGFLQAWCHAYDAAADLEEEDDLQTLFEGIQARTEAMAAVAPAEIADTSEIAVERGRTLNEHIESYGWYEDSPRADARVERDLFRANKELDAYADSNC